jgi:hypothetical protein
LETGLVDYQAVHNYHGAENPERVVENDDLIELHLAQNAELGMQEHFQPIFGPSRSSLLAPNDGLLHAKLAQHPSHRYLQHCHSSPNLFNENYPLLDDYYYRMQTHH